MYDLSAAFDTINKDILEKKLEIYKVGNVTRKLIMTYLTNRTFVIALDGQLSRSFDLKFGCPQGTVLSPFLFLIITNDLWLWTPSEISMTSYADDTTVYTSHEQLNIVVNKLEVTSEIVMKFMASNDLVANDSKTCFLILNKDGEKKDDHETLRVGSCTVSETQSEKLLGIRIDSDLKWKKHVDDLCSSLKYGFFQIRKLRKTLSKDQMVTIGNGLIMSKLQYCASVFGQSYDSTESRCMGSDNMKRLQKLQNDYLRILTGTKSSDKKSISSLLAETNSLSMNQIMGKHILMDTWRIRTNNIEPISTWIPLKHTHESLRSGSKHLIESRIHQQQSFPKKAEKLWNNRDLPTEFRITSKRSTAKNIATKFVKEYIPKIPWAY